MTPDLENDPVMQARMSTDQLAPSLRTIEQMEARFLAFAESECRGYAPFYEALFEAVAGDSDVLDIARQSNPGQPIPNLFFATVHYLLLSDADHPLARYFSTVESSKSAAEPIFSGYRKFCIENRDSLVELLSFRRVQTNVVGRCAYLMPAFGIVSTHAEGRPLALIDVGTSAGLNLIWDKYRYSYSNGREFGLSDSTVRLESKVVGEKFPELPSNYPKVASRVGIDMAPVDLTNPDDLLWSRSLIWPEHPHRASVFDGATAILTQNPPTLFSGDALDLLPGILETVPDDTVPCVFHCHTLNQFTLQARKIFREIIETASAIQAIYLVSAEGGTLVVSRCDSGAWSVLASANCDPHGWWVEWLEGVGS
jgi:hypothetical protein